MNDEGAAFITGMIASSLIWIILILLLIAPRAEKEEKDLKTQILQEAITQHQCKVQSINKGSEVIKSDRICIMSDGTILDMR